jgi:hypothetical protein
MTRKIIISASIVLFIITCGLLAWHHHLEHSIIPHYETVLWEMADKRADEINTLLNEEEKNAIQLAHELCEATTPEAQSLIITAHKEPMGFKNVLLFDKNGIVTLSTTQEITIGQDLHKQNGNNHAALTQSYERARMTLTNDFSEFNFNKYLKEATCFITIPCIKNKKFVGALMYELDEEKIYRITNQYIGLGKTGEVLLTRQDGPHVVFIAGTRNDPDLAFKKQNPITTSSTSIQASLLAQQGTGVTIDYRGKEVVAAWTFVPKLDWGMVVKIDREEILIPLQRIYQLLILFLLLFFLSLVVNTYVYASTIKQTLLTINRKPPLNRIPPTMKNPLFIMLLLCLFFVIKNSVNCVQQKSKMVTEAQKKAVKKTTRNADEIETILAKISFIGQSMGNDLRTHYLAQEDIITRIKRDMAENNIITNITVLFAPYTYGTNTQLYGKSVQKTNDVYEEKTVIESAFKSSWYTKASEHGSTWIVNQSSQENIAENTATYACKFFNKDDELNGVIAVTFSLQNIIRAIEFSGIGQTGYSILTTSNGTFIFHPIQSLVQTQTTLLQFAQSNGNEELAVIAQNTLKSKPILASYRSPTTKERYWIATHPVPLNGWIVGTIFSQDEIDLSAQIIRHYYFWILIWLIASLLFAGGLFYSLSLISVAAYEVIGSLVLLSGLLIAWYAIINTNSINRESKIVITDQSSLNKFLNDLHDEAERKNERAPINIPCGLLLYSISIPDPDHLETSGYIWTKYNTALENNIARGIDLPQATRMIVGKPLTSLSGNYETETWNIQGILSQEQNYGHYPFDQQQLRIILEHKDIEKNIILTPDLIAYKKISPESTPGLDKEFSLAGFTVEQTFFEYFEFDPKANFGFKEHGKVPDHFQLVFNIIMNRNLLNPFILYVLPLLVILFSLFCILLIASKKTDPFSLLGPYTGLFFSLIILQRSLREQHPTGNTLYMEYAFFYTYITIILLILHTILNHFYKYKSGYQDVAFYIIKLLFWPLQLIAWLITTLIVFY